MIISPLIWNLRCSRIFLAILNGASSAHNHQTKVFSFVFLIYQVDFNKSIRKCCDLSEQSFFLRYKIKCFIKHVTKLCFRKSDSLFVKAVSIRNLTKCFNWDYGIHRKKVRKQEKLFVNAGSGYGSFQLS